MTDKLEEAVAEAIVGCGFGNETERQRQIAHARQFDTLNWRAALQEARAVIPIIRNAAMDEAAAVGIQWRDENKAAAAKARKRSRALSAAGFDDPAMSDMLDGAAIECNAIAQAILALKGER